MALALVFQSVRRVSSRKYGLHTMRFIVFFRKWVVGQIFGFLEGKRRKLC